MMHKKYLIGICFAAIAAGVIALAVFGGSRLLEADASCGRLGVQHAVSIKNDKIQPARITGKRCDTMRITNFDAVTREIGFGEHDHHVAYDGVAERLLARNQSMTITFDKTGEYHFHDHFHDEVAATFVVRP